MNFREQNLYEIESAWCDQMTSLVGENRIQDADALYTEYVIDGVEPFDEEWLFVSFDQNVR